MSPSHLLRAHLAPSNPLEAIFVDQAVLASEEMASLASRRPEAPDARWLRHYSQAQALFRRALSDLEKLRKTSPPPAEAAPRPTPSPVVPATSPRPAHAPIPAPFRRPSPFSTLPHVSATPPTPPNPAPSSSPPSDIPWPKPRNRHERRRLDALKRTAGPRLRRPTPTPQA